MCKGQASVIARHLECQQPLCDVTLETLVILNDRHLPKLVQMQTFDARCLRLDTNTVYILLSLCSCSRVAPEIIRPCRSRNSCRTQQDVDITIVACSELKTLQPCGRGPSLFVYGCSDRLKGASILKSLRTNTVSGQAFVQVYTTLVQWTNQNRPCSQLYPLRCAQPQARGR